MRPGDSRSKGRIFVSIVSHGHDDLLPLLLDDLAKQPRDMIQRVLITHNLPPARRLNSPALKPHMVMVDEWVNSSAQGFSSNHNSALKMLDRQLGLEANDWFLVVNPDIRLNDESLVKLGLRNDRQSGIVAPLVLSNTGHPSDAARDLPTPMNLIHRYMFRRRNSESPIWFAGMFLAIRVACWRELAGFDESYFLYCEDVDFCLRARIAGWPLRHETQSTVSHQAQRASHYLIQHFLWHAQSLLRLWSSSSYRSVKALSSARHHRI